VAGVLDMAVCPGQFPIDAAEAKGMGTGSGIVASSGPSGVIIWVAGVVLQRRGVPGMVTYLEEGGCSLRSRVRV
jgi:hypothetical protein